MTLDMLQSWNHHDIAEGMQSERGLESMACFEGETGKQMEKNKLQLF